MQNLVIEAIITATSKKQDGEFQQQVPTKTAYLKADETNSKLLEDFGLTRYTSKEDQEDYFIVKFPQNVVLYFPNGLGERRPDLSLVTHNDVETNNFRTPEDKPLKLNILKGENKGNIFYRLQAILVDSVEDIEEIKPENPFGTPEAF